VSVTAALQPTEALRLSGSYEHGRLTRDDTGLLVYDQHLTSLQAQYAFSRNVRVRGRLDYDSLDGRLFHQVVVGWTPRPGSALYVGYDETGDRSEARSPAYRRRDRALFAKLSWAGRSRLGSRPRRATIAPVSREHVPSASSLWVTCWWRKWTIERASSGRCPEGSGFTTSPA
jgi:hypothetical protein